MSSVEYGFCLVAFVVFLVYVISAAVQSARTSATADEDVRRRHRVYNQQADRQHFVRQRGREGFQSVRASFRALAVMRGGEFHDYGFHGMPKVTFEHRTGRALMTIFEGGGERSEFYTQLTIMMPSGWDNRIEIYRQLFSDEEIALKGIQDIQIGDEEFDPRYIIKADDAAVATQFFTAGVKDAINQIRYMGDRDYVLVSINRERMMIRKAPLLESTDHLRQFVNAGCALYDQIELLSQKALGIELTDADPDEPPTCQVCGSAVDGEQNRVFCRRCRTPHHLDCWEFNKMCSTFACGESVFVRRT